MRVSGILSITDAFFKSDVSDTRDISNHLQVTIKTHIMQHTKNNNAKESRHSIALICVEVIDSQYKFYLKTHIKVKEYRIL